MARSSGELRALILAGTTEARLIANVASSLSGLELTVSYAGATSEQEPLRARPARDARHPDRLAAKVRHADAAAPAPSSGDRGRADRRLRGAAASSDDRDGHDRPPEGGAAGLGCGRNEAHGRVRRRGGAGRLAARRGRRRAWSTPLTPSRRGCRRTPPRPARRRGCHACGCCGRHGRRGRAGSAWRAWRRRPRRCRRARGCC